jgi:hypothetical protein
VAGHSAPLEKAQDARRLVDYGFGTGQSVHWYVLPVFPVVVF